MPDRIPFEQLPESVRHWFGGEEAALRFRATAERFGIAQNEQPTMLRALVALQTKALDPSEFSARVAEALAGSGADADAFTRELIAKLLDPIRDGLASYGVDISKITLKAEEPPPQPPAATSIPSAPIAERAPTSAVQPTPTAPVAPPAQTPPRAEIAQPPRAEAAAQPPSAAAPRATPAPFILHKEEAIRPIENRPSGPVIPREALFRNAPVNLRADSVRAEVDFGDGSKKQNSGARVVHYTAALTRSPLKEPSEEASALSPAPVVIPGMKSKEETVSSGAERDAAPSEARANFTLPPDSREERLSAARLLPKTPAETKKPGGLSLEDFRKKLAPRSAPMRPAPGALSPQPPNQG